MSRCSLRCVSWDEAADDTADLGTSAANAAALMIKPRFDKAVLKKHVLPSLDALLATGLAARSSFSEAWLMALHGLATAVFAVSWFIS